MKIHLMDTVIIFAYLLFVIISGFLLSRRAFKNMDSYFLGGELSRLSVVIFAIVSVIGFLTYAFVGIGKFASIFLPWDLSPEMYAVILMGITTVYVTLGGMYSVVLTDLIQYADSIALSDRISMKM